MTDQMGSGADDLGAAPAGVEASFGVITQYIKDLSFESPNMIRIMTQGGGAGAPEVTMNMGVGANAVGPDTFEVVLSVRAEATRGGGIPAFIVELAYAGIFRLVGIPQDQIEPLLFIEGPRLMFPFARAIIADLTRESGFAPLMLSPIDFVDLYRQKVAERQAQGPDAFPLPDFQN